MFDLQFPELLIIIYFQFLYLLSQTYYFIRNLKNNSSVHPNYFFLKNF